MKGFFTKVLQGIAIAVVLTMLLLCFMLLVDASGWWVLSAPVFLLVAWAFCTLISRGSLRTPPIGVGSEIVTCILTAGDQKKKCRLVIGKDRLVVEMGMSRAQAAYVPLAAITGLLFQQMTILTGFGIDYTDGDGQARLMFVNEGEFQGGRTRKILKAIQDAMMALPMDAPEVTDISRAINDAKNAVVHRV